MYKLLQKKYLPYIVILIFSLMGYGWGYIIQTNRQILRVPGQPAYYFLESTLYIFVSFYLINNRVYLTGQKHNWLKLAVINIFLAIVFVHFLGYFLISR